jgi:hypothetical protein
MRGAPVGTAGGARTPCRHIHKEPAMSSPFHVDGEFSPYRALFVAALLAVVLAQVAAMFMVTRGQVLQAAQRDAQARVAVASPADTSSPETALAPARMLVAGGDMPAR